MTICTLSGGRMEEQYLKTVERYTEGEKGRRAVDSFPHAFGALIAGMENTRKDLLGDIFEGAITFGENGQFFTPEHVCEMMARMSVSEDDTGKRIGDPCCGSGRNLLAAANVSPQNEFVGQDVDLRCVQMTAINLALRGLYGWVILGNSLAFEQRLAYRTGFNGTGFIREATIEEEPPIPPQHVEAFSGPSEDTPAHQLTLF